MKPRCAIRQFLRALPLALAMNAASAAGQVQQGSALDEDIRVHWRIAAVSDHAADQGLSRLDLRLARTGGESVEYRPEQLAVWLKPKANDLSANELSCRDKIAMLAATGQGQRAQIDLTGWRLISFNTDRSVFFINPFLPEKAQIESSPLTLPGDVDHWLSLPGGFSVWAHLRDGAVVRIDTLRRGITDTVQVPPGAAAMAADGVNERIWLALPDSGQIGSFDPPVKATAVATSPAPGIAGLIPAPKGGVYTWSSQNSDIAQRVIEKGKITTQRTWKLPGQPIKAEWSEQSRRLLAALAGGSVSWIDPGRPANTAERTLRVGPEGTRIADFRLFDDGRRLLWLDSEARRAGVIDVASGREILVTAVVSGAESIAFTGQFAYLHSTTQGKATLLSLADIRSGRVQPVEISTGSPSPSAPRGVRAVADPSGHGLLVANPTDGVIYQYSEGMMAPNGSIPNYRRAAIGVLPLNAGLQGAGPGHFTAAIGNERGGRYDLFIGGRNPALAVCSTVVLPEAPATADAGMRHPIRATLAGLNAAGPDGLSSRVQVRLETGESTENPRPLAGVRDLTLLVFDRRTSWQERLHLTEQAPGLYAATFNPPNQGRFDMMVSSVEQDLPVDRGRLGRHVIHRP